MDLKEFKKKHPLVNISSKEDGPLLFYLFEKYPMKIGGMKLIYDRRPSFFSLLEAQSNQWVGFTAKIQERAIFFASVSLNHRYINNEPRKVCYLGDLRSEGNGAFKDWKSGYGDFLNLQKNYFQLDDSSRFFTAILKNNRIAQRILVRSKSKKSFHYDLLKTVQMVNIFGNFKPFFRNKNIRFATESDRDRVQAFLYKTHKEMFLGYDYSKSSNSEWFRRQKSWPGWSLKDFILWEENNKIRALCLAWAPTPVKKMRIQNCPFKLSFLFKILKILGFKGLDDGLFSTLYLTHLSFESNKGKEGATTLNEDRVGQEFSKFLIKNGALKKYNIISYCSQSSQKVDFGLAYQKVDVDLFFVRNSDSPQHKPVNDYIDFEMAIV